MNSDIDLDSKIRAQLDLCRAHGAEYMSSEIDSIVGISREALAGSLPLNGLRYSPVGDSCGWFIWAGKYSEDPDFFIPIHLRHLLQDATFAPRLGLAPGWRFLIGENEYEDVWFDESLLGPEKD